MDKNKPLQTEFEYFKIHKEEFSKTHSNQYVVINDNNVLGFFTTLAEAISKAREKYAPGKFFVELCSPDPSYYHVTLVNWNVS